MPVVKKSESRPTRAAILLSGLVYPGLGQFIQKRWLAGVCFGLLFTTLFCLFMVEGIKIIIAFYRLGLDQVAPDSMPSTVRWMGSFGLCMVVYLANVGDAYFARRRAASRSALRRRLGAVLSDDELAALMDENHEG